MGWCYYIYNETKQVYYYLGGDTTQIQKDLKYVFFTLNWSFDDDISIINDEGINIDDTKIIYS